MQPYYRKKNQPVSNKVHLVVTSKEDKKPQEILKENGIENGGKCTIYETNGRELHIIFLHKQEAQEFIQKIISLPLKVRQNSKELPEIRLHGVPKHYDVSKIEVILEEFEFE